MNLAVCLSTRVRFGVTIFEKSIQITGTHQFSDEARFLPVLMEFGLIMFDKSYVND